MKKQAKDIKKNDKIIIAGTMFNVEEIEMSDAGLGKSGRNAKRKVRIVAIANGKEKLIIIRPENYPIECLNNF